MYKYEAFTISEHQAREKETDNISCLCVLCLSIEKWRTTKTKKRERKMVNLY